VFKTLRICTFFSLSIIIGSAFSFTVYGVTVSGTVTCNTLACDTGNIYICALPTDAAHRQDSDPFEFIKVSNVGSYTLSDIPNWNEIWIGAYWDVDGDGIYSDGGPGPELGEFYGMYPYPLINLSPESSVSNINFNIDIPYIQDTTPPKLLGAECTPPNGSTWDMSQTRKIVLKFSESLSQESGGYYSVDFGEGIDLICETPPYCSTLHLLISSQEILQVGKEYSITFNKHPYIDTFDVAGNPLPETVYSFTQINSTSNENPDKPTLISPNNSTPNIALDSTLQAGPFSDNDVANYHNKSEWQLSTNQNFTSNTFHRTSTDQLTSITIPQLVLLWGETYYWRVRYYDNYNIASEWSDPYSFTTILESIEDSPNQDDNDNGIINSQEVDDSVDLNEDEIADKDQSKTTISSVNTEASDGQIGVEIPEENTTIISIESAKSVDPATISDNENKPADMPLGVLLFTLKVANNGDTASVNIYFSKPMPIGAKWIKYDPINGWQDYGSHAVISPDRTSAKLDLKDGGYGDADGTENGIIVDPSGIGSPLTVSGESFNPFASAGSDSDDGGGDGGGSGGGGCFVDTLRY